MNIGIVGLGFVGLTLGMHLAKVKSTNVYGFETNQTVIDHLQKGDAPFYEPGLVDLIKAANGKNFFLNHTDTSLDAVFVTVGTPLRKGSNIPDLSYVNSALQSVISNLNKEAIVFLRSTVAIGQSRSLQETIHKSGRRDIGVCFSPERTVEGDALNELQILPQLFSADSKFAPHARTFLESMNFKLVEAESLETAEAAKLLSNTYRDIRFSIANLFALVCEDQGLSFNSVRRVAEYRYPRNNFGNPGFVSGPCLSKDSYIVRSTLQNKNLTNLVTVGREIENLLVKKVADKVREHSGRKWLFTGLAFKGQPETSDLRDSSVVMILKELEADNLDLSLHDFSIAPHLLLHFGYPVLRSDAIYEVESSQSAIFIGNNSLRYWSSDFKVFIESFLAGGGFVFDAWGMLDMKHENVISIGAM